MSHGWMRGGLCRALLAALAMVCAAAPPARAQARESVRTFLGGVLDEAREFVAGPAPDTVPPRQLRPCGSLYGPDAREVARGPLNDHDAWVRASYDIIRELGPLPLCFAPGHDTLTSNQGRYLLHANNYFLALHRRAPYLLTGYADPQERDPRLGLRRAEEVRLRSAAPECRYQLRGAAAATLEQRRKVHYSPAPAGCGPSPPPAQR